LLGTKGYVVVVVVVVVVVFDMQFKLIFMTQVSTGIFIYFGRLYIDR
jgi:hypothetical protein